MRILAGLVPGIDGCCSECWEQSSYADRGKLWINVHVTTIIITTKLSIYHLYCVSGIQGIDIKSRYSTLYSSILVLIISIDIKIDR